MFTQLTPNLTIFHGNINVGVLRDIDRLLLIDCGDAAVARHVSGTIVEMLFTHHHRDQACGAAKLAAQGARVCVPSGEIDCFAAPHVYWNDPAFRYHVYDFHPHHNLPAEALPVHRTLAQGDTIAWGNSLVTTLETPGHTDGSVSYLVEANGKRVAFVGDLIYAPGQIWDLFSLQKGNDIVRDYHGFLGSRDQVVASLRKILATGADVLVPSHGVIMDNLAEAVDLLEERLDACYENYASISALRYYFPQMFPERLSGPEVMPAQSRLTKLHSLCIPANGIRGLGGRPRTAKPASAGCTSRYRARINRRRPMVCSPKSRIPFAGPPSFVTHNETTWTIASQSGAVFVIDCGYRRVIDDLLRRQADSEITGVEGLWISHYHDDHVDAIREFKETFGAEVIADQMVADVIDAPLSWRLTCISDVVANVDRRTVHGERWQWREFTMNAFTFPGQTLYHGALLVEGRGERLLFVGDSFTPSGIDDYCAHNRNFLGVGLGFDKCLGMVAELNPVTMFNNHVDVGFTFTDSQIAFMRETLAKREQLFGLLLPWENVNYGLDDSWVRCSPYEQQVPAGATLSLDVLVTNHSSTCHAAALGITLPTAWGGGYASAASESIPPKADGRVSFNVAVPGQTPPGRYILPVDIEFAGHAIRQFNECIVQVI